MGTCRAHYQGFAGARSWEQQHGTNSMGTTRERYCPRSSRKDSQGSWWERKQSWGGKQVWSCGWKAFSSTEGTSGPGATTPGHTAMSLLSVMLPHTELVEGAVKETFLG